MQTRDFSLQPALTYKQRMEETCQLELADLEACCVRAARTLDLLVELERHGLAELNRQHVAGPLNMNAIGLTFTDLQVLRSQIDEQSAVLEDLANRVSKKREDLIEVAKEKKALEKLREKHDSLVAQAVAKSENLVMEEIATNQFHRRGKAERQ